MIEVKNVTKTYGKKQNAFRALKDVSLTIPDGASVAILGKSGSGKSTLMHAMSGLDRPEKGEVVIGVEALVREHSPKAVFESVPMLRGRIVTVAGRKAEEIAPSPEARACSSLASASMTFAAASRWVARAFAIA